MTTKNWFKLWAQVDHPVAQEHLGANVRLVKPHACGQVGNTRLLYDTSKKQSRFPARGREIPSIRSELSHTHWDGSLFYNPTSTTLLYTLLQVSTGGKKRLPKCFPLILQCL